MEPIVEVRCRGCTMAWTVLSEHRGESLPELLKRAWEQGLDHAWENRGHIVQTFVDGQLRATQQVAEMNRWNDHRSLVVEEGSCE